MASLVGQQLGNYRLTRLIGQGGFADVYLGEHVHLNTFAAIKVLQTRLAEGDIENFRQEARYIARLKHPHIVQILDFGVEQNGPFLVMEYAPNGTLRQRHSTNTLVPPAAVVSYIKQVADALQYAHNQRVAHRDIKPENMLIGSNGTIILSDFGLAMTSQSSRYQSTKEMIGTVAYMAPEQIQGKPQLASDQYALGITVYEWLTGTRPFHGSVVEISVQHLTVAPPSLRQRVPTLSQDIEAVVLKALAKDPQQRFTSVQAFATSLEDACASTTHLSQAETVLVNQSLPNNLIQPTVLSSDSSKTMVLSSPSGQTALTSASFTIGRAPDNQYSVNDARVSGHHALICAEGQGHILIDLGSTNGTFVNGQRLVPQVARPLMLKDKIGIGNTSYIYDVAETSQLSLPKTERAPEYEATIAATIVTPTVAPTIVATPPPVVPPAPPVSLASTLTPQHNSKRGLWVGVALAAALVLLIIGGASVLAYSAGHSTTSVSTSTGGTIATIATDTPTPIPTDTPTPMPTDTPTPVPTDTPTPIPTDPPTPASGSGSSTTYTNYAQAMNAYCDYMGQQDYQDAYQVLSTRLQSTVSEQQFASDSNQATCGQHSTFFNTQTGVGVVVLLTNPSGTYRYTYYLIQESDGGWRIDGIVRS